MAGLAYSFAQPEGYTGQANIGQRFTRSYDAIRQPLDEANASQSLAALGNSLEQPAAAGGKPSLSEYGLPAREVLLPMLQNPQTRDQALGLIRDATSKRDDALDPVKQLQLKKLQYDVAHQGDGPGLTAEQRNFQYSQKNPGFADFIGNKGADKAPAEVQQYMFYRDGEAAAGRQPMSYMDFRNSGKSGFSVQTNPDGTVSVQQGPGAGKPLTEAQSKDVGFVTRAAGALPTIDQLGDSLTNLGESVAGKTPLVGNYLKSPEYQQAEQAGDEFLNAFLRKDSGAAISAEERQSFGETYLPRPGNSPQLLAQKKAARARAIAGIQLGLPAQAILNLEKAGVQLPPPDAAGPNSGAAPQGKTQVVDGMTYTQDGNGDWYAN